VTNEMHGGGWPWVLSDLKSLLESWDQLRPEQRAMTSRTLLAERILKSAAKGERDPKRLRDAALTANAA
jgi:hypothetical protein